MCGIVGIYAYHPAAPSVDRDELRRIRDHMAVRGPDGKGEWYADDGRVGLGHRRLSIIDLSEKAAQPMQNTDGSLVISFNGEIYNYKELRWQLEAKGYKFRSHSDTEVLLHLYAERGVAMLEDLRGMFAFALWDVKRQAMLLARDPYGIKPLYYADDGLTVRAASQVKALLAGGRVSEAPEPAGIAGFYLFGNVPEPFTTIQEMRAVPAGSYVWVNDLGPSEPEHYFSIAGIFATAEQQQVDISTDAAQQLIREAVADSVRHHLVADVPVGVFLSAGIDSGAIAGLMADVLQESATHGPRFSTVTMGFSEFEGQYQDESPLAEEVARYYQTKHTTRQLDMAEFICDLPKVLEAMDQPTIDGVNTWFVSKAAKERGWKVALSGLGGDELFGGYPSFQDIPRWVRMMSTPSRIPLLGDLFHHLHSLFTTRHSPKTAGFVKYGGTYAGAYLLKRGLFLPEELSQVMDREMAREGLRRLKPLALINSTLTPDTRPLISNRRPPTSFRRVAVMESSLYMRNQLLRDADWAGMAHSLEIRTPLVDAHLLKKVAPVLLSAKFPKGKDVLALAPKRPLPTRIRTRAKTGFAVPVDRWLQQEKLFDAWRSVPTLNGKNCPWARRWAYIIAANCYKHK